MTHNPWAHSVRATTKRKLFWTIGWGNFFAKAEIGCVFMVHHDRLHIHAMAKFVEDMEIHTGMQFTYVARAGRPYRFMRLA